MTVFAPPSSWSVVVATIAVFWLAGLVKGVVGLGLPTISMALLALLMAPSRAAALLVVPSLVTNVWQIRPWSSLGPMSRRLATLLVGVVIGTIAGGLVLGAPGQGGAMWLGIALVVYAGWALSGAKATIRPRDERWLSPVVGVVTGAVTAATGVFVVPAVPYLQALSLDRDALIQAMGLSFTVSTIALAAALVTQSAYSAPLLAASAAMLLPALVGMRTGEWLRTRLSPVLFRRVFLSGLLALGLEMIVHALIAG